MNKKGFTLVELLAVISILVLMSLIIGVNITSILRSTEKNSENFDKEQIEKAACVFADSEANSSGLCKNTTGDCNEISVSMLINSGLLDKTYKTRSGTITVNRNSTGKKKCSYTE